MEHGLYAIDYPAEKYAEYQAEAKARLDAELIRLLREKQSGIVLELSFCDRDFRDEFKGMVEQNVGRWVLVFLDAGNHVVRQRIAAQRAAQREPVGEGEVAIKVV
ncbi:Uncharacterized protein TPAR_07969 [Tolypocladium paradoxum]|uniref:Uncharacterized protein n=1 Tax=Tolypocladium paradoxum TaxID=94208 RepID=A0A2S4KNP9_9HYPO|nr:Uncharacterized protein TPAR_07969 [Tolypocladium paradoxum]